MKNRFLFKIWAGYDGFNPAAIPARKKNGLLPLGWSRYIDEVENGDEVWVYFRATSGFAPSVYIKGTVRRVDHDAGLVYLLCKEESTTTPLVDARTAEQVGRVVRARGQQVFAMPSELAALAHGCDLDTSGESCGQRRCDQCPNWQRFRLIRDGDYASPRRLSRLEAQLVPAYWIAPRRCYLGGDARPEVSDVTRHFTNLKSGNTTKAFPFAWGMAQQLTSMAVETDEIVPIPLSPDKAANREVHRTKLLAQELSRLIGVPLKQRLRLTQPISKRRPPWVSLSSAQFENAYFEALRVVSPSSLPAQILLVDDVCTRGATTAAAVKALRMKRPDIEVVIATGGLMIVAEVVRKEAYIRRARRKGARA